VTLLAATLAACRTNRTIMRTDPTARHSLIGPFQRVCYLVHVGARTTDPTLVNSPAAMTTVRGPPTPGIADRPGRAGP
jgi:hypothetical protein